MTKFDEMYTELPYKFFTKGKEIREQEISSGVSY